MSILARHIARGASVRGRVVWLVLAVVVLLAGGTGWAASALVSPPTVPAVGTVAPAGGGTAHRPAALPAAPVARTVATSAPTSTPATPAHPAPPTAVPGAPVSITIRWGDTLWGLAREYGTTVAALQEANHLGGSSLIRADATLLLPTPHTAGASASTPDPTRHPIRVPESPASHHRIGVRTHSATATALPARSTGTVPTSIPAPTVGTTVGADQVRRAAAVVFGSQYACAANIITRESGWNVHATNPTSGAYGLAQALPATKMATAGPGWRDDPATQLAWMRTYVTARYGGACGAWAFWQAHAWY
jgi:LysM repeat protein